MVQYTHMQKIFIKLILILVFLSAPVAVSAATWKPATPDGYTSITWAKATGIASFFKAPSGNGMMDFITRIYLPQNRIRFITSPDSQPTDWGVAKVDFTSGATTVAAVIPTTTDPNDPFSSDTSTPPTPVVDPSPVVNAYHNMAFSRFVAEGAKATVPDAKFIWNGPFFNTSMVVSDLSMALKSTVGTTTLVSSGSRPPNDMAAARRMLLINNKTGRANISDFDANVFVSTSSGDQGIEAFAPTVAKTDSASGAAARLFMGVTGNGQELVIYCSQAATVDEASAALEAAGVAPENQLEADGGGSAACGYNMPGQFFVEPSRTLPLMMGADTILARGIAASEGANVRSGAGAKNSIVTKLKKGEPVIVYAEKSGWYKIGDGQWVIKSLIKKQ